MGNIQDILRKNRSSFYEELSACFLSSNYPGFRLDGLNEEPNYYDFVDKHIKIEHSFLKFLVLNVLDALFANNGIIDKEFITRKGLFADCWLSEVNNNGYLFRIERTGYKFKNSKDIAEIRKSDSVDNVIVLSFNNIVKQKDCLSFRSFLLNNFDEDTVNEYLNFLKSTLCDVYNKCGYVVSKHLSLEGLINFKKSLHELLLNFDISKEVYILGKDNVVDVQLSNKAILIIKENLFKNNFYNLILGNNEFAKCFITSEHLYQNIKEEKNFDYTSVVCGYLKTIENILFLFHISSDEDISLRYAKYNPANKKSVDKFNIRKGKEIDFECENNDKVYSYLCSEEYIEMNNLIDRLKYNRKFWLLDLEDRNKIIYLLNDYRKRCRNEHLHIDIIDNEDDVKTIRNNTIVLMFYLFGGYKFIDKSLLNFDYYNPVYNKLYSEINNLSFQNRFIIYFDNVPLKCCKINDFKETNIDPRTTMITSKIEFAVVDDLDMPLDKLEEEAAKSKKVVFISKDKIPTKVYWYYNKQKHEIYFR